MSNPPTVHANAILLSDLIHDFSDDKDSSSPYHNPGVCAHPW